MAPRHCNRQSSYLLVPLLRDDQLFHRPALHAKLPALLQLIPIGMSDSCASLPYYRNTGFHHNLEQQPLFLCASRKKSRLPMIPPQCDPPADLPKTQPNCNPVGCQHTSRSLLLAPFSRPFFSPVIFTLA